MVSMKRPDGSRIVYSHVRRYEWRETDASCFSIKYVLRGLENYTVNGHSHPVQDQQYLLINRQQSYEINLNSRTPVLGLCLFLSDGLLHETVRYLTSSDARLLDEPVAFDTPTHDFCEMRYSVHSDLLGAYLQEVMAHTDPVTGEIFIDDTELYYQVATRLLHTQHHVRRQLTRIPARRPATRQELLRRVSIARHLIDSRLSDETSIAQLAAASAMSEFHFFRTFKQVFGVSPHQYRIQRRLQWAAEQLRSHRMSQAEVACMAGFADVQAFSKAFKKAFGISPGACPGR